MTQLALIFERIDAGCVRMRVAIGEPGLDHAREMLDQAFEIEPSDLDDIAELITDHTSLALVEQLNVFLEAVGPDREVSP